MEKQVRPLFRRWFTQNSRLWAQGLQRKSFWKSQEALLGALSLLHHCTKLLQHKRKNRCTDSCGLGPPLLNVQSASSALHAVIKWKNSVFHRKTVLPGNPSFLNLRQPSNLEIVLNFEDDQTLYYDFYLLNIGFIWAELLLIILRLKNIRRNYSSILLYPSVSKWLRLLIYSLVFAIWPSCVDKELILETYGVKPNECPL